MCTYNSVGFLFYNGPTPDHTHIFQYQTFVLMIHLKTVHDACTENNSLQKSVSLHVDSFLHTLEWYTNLTNIQHKLHQKHINEIKDKVSMFLLKSKSDFDFVVKIFII